MKIFEIAYPLKGPIDGLADYHAPPQKRLWLLLIPEFIGFAYMGLMVYYGRSKKR
jgi:hypothetical protein